MTTWSEVDEPVLRWLADFGPTFIPQGWQFQFALRDYAEPAEEVEGLTSEQMDQALTRLFDHGLIDGRRTETIGYSIWTRLRVTALGLQLLGEWPELDRLANAEGLRLLLTALADQADTPEEGKALRRTVGVLSKLGDQIVEKTLNDVAGEAGTGLTDDL